MTIRLKISLLFTALVSLLLLGICTAIYIISVKERDNQFYTRVKNRAAATANAVGMISDNNYRVLEMLDTASVASLQNKSTTVLDDSGRLVYRYSDDPRYLFTLTADVIREVKREGECYFSLDGRKAVSIELSNAGRKYIVTVAAEDVDGQAFLNDLKSLLIWIVAVAVLLTFMAGFVFAGVLLRPLTRIIGEVKLVSSNNLSQRIHTGSNGDELQQLGKTFNELLDKIQESFIIQRRFISNASHELSTPLTSVMNQLEVAMLKQRSADEYHQVIQSVYDDVKDLHQLTRSLLEIAKSGSQGSLELEEVRVDEVLMKVAADVQKLKAEHIVQLFFETLPDDEHFLTVFGNANLLSSAFRNIVENACKYSDNHTAVINVSFGNARIIVSVKSFGDVIAESDIQNVFQPFFRAKTVMHKQGSGLGLTLAKRIFSIHHSSIDVASSPTEGTLFTISLPNTLQSSG